jgi:predicted nuclease with TOPRIM domain
VKTAKKKPNTTDVLEGIQALEQRLSELLGKVQRIDTDMEPAIRRGKELRQRIEHLERATIGAVSNQEIERRFDPVRERLAALEEKLEMHQPPHINALWEEMLTLRSRIEKLEGKRNTERHVAKKKRVFTKKKKRK